METRTNNPNRGEGIEIPPALTKMKQDSLENIRRLKARASRGLFSLAVFVTISIGAVRDFDFLPSFPSHVRAMLGRPPSSNMISAALMLYSFSAIILILSRMMSGASTNTGLAHVGYLSGFFFFYHFAGAMEENFWAVFAAGVTILTLESYHTWTRCTEEIKKEEESLSEIERAIRRNSGDL